jgi:hypothetical protein
MRNSKTQIVFDYFNRVRGGRTAPLRADIDPSALKSVLPDIFILGMGRNGSPIFRLAGTRICALLGRELRGEEFSGIWHAPNRHKMKLAAEAVLANQAPLTVDIRTLADEEDSGRLEMLLAPLCSRPGICDRFIGSLVDLGEPPLRSEKSRILLAQGIDFIADAGLRADDAPSYAAIGAAPRHFSGNRAVRFTVLEGGRKD